MAEAYRRRSGQQMRRGGRGHDSGPAAKPAAEGTSAAQCDNRIRKNPKCRDKYRFLALMRQNRFSWFSSVALRPRQNESCTPKRRSWRGHTFRNALNRSMCFLAFSGLHFFVAVSRHSATLPSKPRHILQDGWPGADVGVCADPAGRAGCNPDFPMLVSLNAYARANRLTASSWSWVPMSAQVPCQSSPETRPAAAASNHNSRNENGRRFV
jgi:hypothetical protein